MQCVHTLGYMGSTQVATQALEIRDALERCMADYFKHFVAVAEIQGWMMGGFDKLTSVEMWEAPKNEINNNILLVFLCPCTVVPLFLGGGARRWKIYNHMGSSHLLVPCSL